MNKLRYLVLLAVVMLMVGCSTENTMTEAAQSDGFVQEQTEDQGSKRENNQAEELSAETHLELVLFEDYSLYYSMDFQKIEGGTGDVLTFEGNTELENQKRIESDNVEVESEESLWYLGYGFVGEKNIADTVKIMFWNKGGAEEVTVKLDGMEYKVELSKVMMKEKLLNQPIKMDSDGTEAILEKAVIYPDALLLVISRADNEHWDTIIDLKDSKAENGRKGWICSNYDEQSKEAELLYVFHNGFPDGFPDGKITLLVKECETGFAEDAVYYENAILLE